MITVLYCYIYKYLYIKYVEKISMTREKENITDYHIIFYHIIIIYLLHCVCAQCIYTIIQLNII